MLAMAGLGYDLRSGSYDRLSSVPIVKKTRWDSVLLSLVCSAGRAGEKDKILLRREILHPRVGPTAMRAIKLSFLVKAE